jgi:hypothetical protein
MHNKRKAALTPNIGYLTHCWLFGGSPVLSAVCALMAKHRRVLLGLCGVFLGVSVGHRSDLSWFQDSGSTLLSA